MSKIIKIDAIDYSSSIHEACEFLRKKHNIPREEIVSPAFEKEFNCKVTFGTYDGSMIITINETDWMMFLLKWQ